VRMVGQVRGIAPQAVTIGMRVTVRFEVAGEMGIPYFVPISAER
jgi:hypothetical protein